MAGATIAALAACARTTMEPRTSTTSGFLAESTCAGCHAAQVAEWRGSMHERSFTSEEFQQSYRQEPRDYCVACHAPLPDRTAGIGCTACHAANEGHLASGPERTHPTTKACPSCHDFDVPGSRAMLQSTEREHRESTFAERSCESCHLKRGGHRFDVTRNAELLAKAIDVGDAHAEPDGVVVRVASRGVGHRFPTGDLFRRLTVVVAGYDDKGALTCAETFHFTRHVDEHRAQRETEEHDTRLGPEPRDLHVACADRPARVHVDVRYERGSGGSGDDFTAFATLDLVDRDVPLR